MRAVAHTNGRCRQCLGIGPRRKQARCFPSQVLTSGPGALLLCGIQASFDASSAGVPREKPYKRGRPRGSNHSSSACQYNPVDVLFRMKHKKLKECLPKMNLFALLVGASFFSSCNRFKLYRTQNNMSQELEVFRLCLALNTASGILMPVVTDHNSRLESTV